MDVAETTAEQIAALLDGIIRRQRRTARADVSNPVTHAQFRVLRTIAANGHPLRLSELAAQLGIVPRSATSVVDDLEAATLVARHPDPNDRRATLVDLTPTGHQILQSLREKRREVMADQLSRLTPEEQQTLATLLQRLSDD